jgi:3-oxoacyl-[acyl-carrier protein] reductase
MTSFLQDEAKEEIINSIPLQRLGNVDDVSKLVYFLASDKASYITGQTISVDGGLLMY